MKKGLIIAIVVIIVIIIAGVVAFMIVSSNMNKEFEARARAEGVPEICIENRYNSDECTSFCETNPTDCGRTQSSNEGENTEGVPQICLDNNYDQVTCSNFCDANPADCGR